MVTGPCPQPLIVAMAVCKSSADEGWSVGEDCHASSKVCSVCSSVLAGSGVLEELKANMNPEIPETPATS